MKKIIEDVVAEEKQNKKGKKSTAKKFDISKALPALGTDNAELEQVLAGLTTTIKVVGCGGAGTNTISRCFGEKFPNNKAVDMFFDLGFYCIELCSQFSQRG